MPNPLQIEILFARRKHQHLNVPAPDTRTKAKQVLGASGSEAGDFQEGEGGGDIDETAAAEEGGAGPPGGDQATEEYKDEQTFRRWVVTQVSERQTSS